MQELQEREKEKQKWRDLLANTREPTPEERTEHVRKLQFEQGVGLFAVAYSTLHKAACDGNVDGLKWFLTGKGRSGGGPTGGKVNVDDFDAAGMCAIHYAAERGHDSSVEFLLKRKCAIDVESGNGNTSLHYAAAKNKCSTIRLCHERGANLLARNKAGLTAAHFAANSDHIEALEVLVELFNEDLKKAHAKVEEASAAGQGGGAADDRPAAAAGVDDLSSAEDADSLISGVDEGLTLAVALVKQPKNIVIDAQSSNQSRPIHLAASFDCRRTLGLLLKSGVNPNSQDFMGESAMHKAARKNFHLAYDMLQEAGGADKLLSNMHETPAHLLQDSTAL
jgi:hypothetical protein